MNRQPEDEETSKSIEQEHSISFDLMLPARQSGFAITDQQWNQLKRQVSRIRPSESLWFSASLAFLTVGISFLISVTQIGSAESWIATAFWTAAAAGFIGALVCGIAYWENKKRRTDDIQAVLRYMETIEQTYRD